MSRPRAAHARGRSLGILAALGLAACAARPGPEGVLVDYLSAEQSGRYAEAHQLLTAEDRRARPLEAYVAEHLSAGPIWLAVAERTRFDVGRIRRADDHATAVVRARQPDPLAVQEGLGAPPIERIEAAPDPAGAMRAWVAGQVDAGAFPERTETLTYGLREEDGAWRVWLALDRLDAVVAAVRHARAAEEAGDADAARAAWREVLALPPDPGGVVAAFHDEARQRLDALGAAPAPQVSDDAGG